MNFLDSALENRDFRKSQITTSQGSSIGVGDEQGQFWGLVNEIIASRAGVINVRQDYRWQLAHPREIPWNAVCPHGKKGSAENQKPD